MNTIFIDSKNSKTSDPHRLSLNLKDKIDFRRKGKCMALSILSIYSTWTNIKKSYRNNKLKISPPTCHEEFELPDGSYSITDIRRFRVYIKKAGWKKS